MYNYWPWCYLIDEYSDDSTTTTVDNSDPLAPLTVKQTATLALLFGIVVSNILYHHLYCSNGFRHTTSCLSLLSHSVKCDIQYYSFCCENKLRNGQTICWLVILLNGDSVNIIPLNNYSCWSYVILYVIITT